MNQFTIFCTPSQTRKALELGAPLKTFIHVEPEFSMANGCLPYPEEIEMYEYPTAEQMIGWLEEQYIYITIRYTNDVAKHWQADVDRADCIDYECGKHLVDYNYPSRKEATIAAIDAALEYLSNNKE